MANTLYGITGHSGAMGAALGMIWVFGLGLATYAWLKMPTHRR